MVVILFYQSFTVTDIVTLFYENVLLYSHIVKLNYHQTPVPLQLLLIKNHAKVTIIFDNYRAVTINGITSLVFMHEKGRIRHTQLLHPVIIE